jgi:hypothetical protein
MVLHQSADRQVEADGNLERRQVRWPARCGDSYQHKNELQQIQASPRIIGRRKRCRRNTFATKCAARPRDFPQRFGSRRACRCSLKEQPVLHGDGNAHHRLDPGKRRVLANRRTRPVDFQLRRGRPLVPHQLRARYAGRRLGRNAGDDTRTGSRAAGRARHFRSARCAISQRAEAKFRSEPPIRRLSRSSFTTVLQPLRAQTGRRFRDRSGIPSTMLFQSTWTRLGCGDLGPAGRDSSRHREPERAPAIRAGHLRPLRTNGPRRLFADAKDPREGHCAGRLRRPQRSRNDPIRLYRLSTYISRPPPRWPPNELCARAIFLILFGPADQPTISMTSVLDLGLDHRGLRLDQTDLLPSRRQGRRPPQRSVGASP